MVLDQIRALAVFIVFSYQFLMALNDGVHAGSTSFIGNALFAEGNTGVGTFMTLSGYLLVRLARDRDIISAHSYSTARFDWVHCW